MLVKVAPMGGVVKEVSVDHGANVGDALAAAEVSVGDREIRINGTTVEEDTALTANVIITLVPKVKGGLA